MKYLPLLAILFIACQPIAKVYPGKYSGQYEPVAADAPFQLYERDTMDMDRADLIASIWIGESGMTINCSYQSVISLAEQKSRSLGGNCFVVTRVLWPDGFSSCYRIGGDVYRLNEIDIASSKLYWYADRELEISDYEGRTANKPSIAETAVGLTYDAEQNQEGKTVVEVLAFFDKDSSYFVQSQYNFEQLRFEKLHFDIAELHARKLRQAMKNQIHSLEDLNQMGKILLDSASANCRAMQDAYVKEVYADPITQESWNAEIAISLIEHQEFAAPKIIIE